MHETEHRCSGHDEWYALDTIKFHNHIKTKWIQLKKDEQTLNFLEHCYDKSDWVLTQLYHSVAQSVLNWFMTKTSINGLLRRGSMFVFSTAHFGQLLHATSATQSEPTCACAFNARCPCIKIPPPGARQIKESSITQSTTLYSDAEKLSSTHPSSSSHSSPSSSSTSSSAPRLLKSLLDLGAGDGEVTANMAPYFERVFATETSKVMQWRLEEKGYVVLDPFTWDNAGEASVTSSSSVEAPRHYDVIACLNLLDRCSKPLTLLHQIYDRLEPAGGRLVVALVLPFHPYVEFGPLSPNPEEKLLVDGDSIEDQINSLVDVVFSPIGFSLEAVTRLPYLCEGDLSQAFYVLEDVVFVFRKGGGGVVSGLDSPNASESHADFTESATETFAASDAEEAGMRGTRTKETSFVESALEDGFCRRDESPNL